jgi:hypothetical protein
MESMMPTTTAAMGAMPTHSMDMDMGTGTCKISVSSSVVQSSASANLEAR